MIFLLKTNTSVGTGDIFRELKKNQALQSFSALSKYVPIKKDQPGSVFGTLHVLTDLINCIIPLKRKCVLFYHALLPAYPLKPAQVKLKPLEI